MKTRQVHLVSRPEGFATPDNFVVRQVDLPALKEGQVLVENLYMSIDPYMRRSMEPVATDLPPWPIHDALNGPSIGKVIESRNSKYAVGDLVESMSGWQEHFISDADDFVAYLSPDNAIAKRVLANGAEPKDFLGILGVAAQTSYFGMMCAAKPVAGETLVVSSGAGVVGSVACQIGKIKGMRVVSSAGSDAKVAWLKEELGVDYAFNYKKTAISEGLKAGCPNGVDLVLESASPEHFSACLPLMNEQKLLLIAGFISIYNSGGVVKNISNFEYVLDRFLTIKSYPFMAYLDAYDQFVNDMLSWRAAGRMRFKEAIHEGLESAPAALCNLFSGAIHGKSLVRLKDYA